MRRTETEAEPGYRSVLAREVAQRVRWKRRDMGLSARELSDRTYMCGMRVTRSVIADLETGRKNSLDVSEAVVLSDSLGITLSELILGYDNEYARGRAELAAEIERVLHAPH